MTIDCWPPRRRGNTAGVRLRVATATRWLLVSNVAQAIAEPGDGSVAQIRGRTGLVKKGVTATEQAEINKALSKLASAAGLTMTNRSRVEIARVRLPEVAIEGGAGPAFRRAILLSLVKLDFVDRAALSERGSPIVDLSKLGLSPAALASLAQIEEGDDGEDEDQASGDSRERARRSFERALPNPEERGDALRLLAYAIENANDERPSGWHIRDRGDEVGLFAGRLWACGFAKGQILLSVLGPISPEAYSAIGAEEQSDGEFKAIPRGRILRFPASKASVALEVLKGAFDRFVDEAMARMRRPLDPAYHVTELVDHVAAFVQRQLPQPTSETVEAEEFADDGGDAEVAITTQNRGRGPIFDKGHRSIISLISDIDQDRIALPDLQRPFVWEDTKVRDLLDSLFVGYPAGTIVLWRTDDTQDARSLGSDAKARQASSLVIDGQQRLTSLYAVVRGVPVLDKDGEKRQIRIAFRPRDGRFEVLDAAIAKDPEYLPDVSEIWRGRSKPEIRKQMLAALRGKGREIDVDYENAVEHNLERLKALDEFEFPVVEIRKNEASDEDVADIFVRINNRGTRLGQADFVLTLLSVYHGPLRDKIEQRAAEITKDSVVDVDTQQMLRAACAVGFERARMSAVYRYLRGVDPVSGETSTSARKARLEQLDQAATACIDPTTWRDFGLRVAHSGFVSAVLIASPNAVTNAFAFYVKGQRAGLEKHRLDKLISRWLFATLLTARYSTSSETVFETDLGRVRGPGANDGDKFEQALDAMLSEAITGDYWSQTLVGELRTQRSRAPSALAFRAAQVVLGARALFSDQSLQTLLAPTPTASRAAAEQHHLFPKAWLQRRGFTDRSQINQVANLADVGWTENSEIGASAPASYVARLREKLRLDDDRWGRMCAEHALPPDWDGMPYETFLYERRSRMAHVIRAAFRKLGGEEDAAPIAPPWFLPGADAVWSRIVETELALRAVVREIYGKRFAVGAAAKIEAALSAPERETLTRALRGRPATADPLSVVDYLYLKQLPALLFSNEVWSDAKVRLGNVADAKHRLSTAVDSIAPVRNEIAHVREVSPERLQKAHVACNDVLALTGKA